MPLYFSAYTVLIFLQSRWQNYDGVVFEGWDFWEVDEQWALFYIKRFHWVLKYCDGKLYEQLMWDKSTVGVKLSLNPFTCMLNGYPYVKTFITQKPYT